METTSGDLFKTSAFTRTCKVRGLLVVEAAKEPQSYMGFWRDRQNLNASYVLTKLTIFAF